MKAFILRYPFSIAIILLVTFLSFFKPPSTDINDVPGIDKLVHTGMYFVMASMLWWEFYKGQKKTQAPIWHAWVGAFLLCPLIYGGLVELLQEFFHTTSWRRVVGLCCQLLRGVGSLLQLLAIISYQRESVKDIRAK